MENSRHYVVFNVWSEEFCWHDNGDPPSFTSFRKETVGTLSNYIDDHNDDFKKNDRFNDQNNSSARASRFLVHFFDVHCTTTTWNLLI